MNKQLIMTHSEKVKLSTNSSTFLIKNKNDVTRYIERLEREQDRKERAAFERRVKENMRKKEEEKQHARNKKECDAFYFEDIY
jgi:hypothetical protein